MSKVLILDYQVRAVPFEWQAELKRQGHDVNKYQRYGNFTETGGQISRYNVVFASQNNGNLAKLVEDAEASGIKVYLFNGVAPEVADKVRGSKNISLLEGVPNLDKILELVGRG